MPFRSRPYQTPRVRALIDRTRCAFVAAAVLAALTTEACKRQPPPQATAAPSVSSASASASVSVSASSDAPSPRCRAVDSAGLRVTLGSPVHRPAAAANAEEGEGDDDVAAPYAPEIGVGAALDGGFAVSALLPEKGATRAVLAILGSNLGAGRTIELLKVHGDVSPPRVAAFGKSLIVAIPDGAPSGALVRLARVDSALDAPAGSAPSITWGAEFSRGGGEDSESLALEAGTKTAIVAWDDFSSRDGVEVVKLVAFSPNDIKKTSVPAILSSLSEDADGPLVARRAGGFWVAWTTRTKPPAAPAPSAHGDHPPSDTTEAVDTGPRGIVILPLDENGKPAGAPLHVTSKDAHVQGFDLAPAENGGALVAFRDDATVDGTSGGVARLVVVHADGSLDPRTVADEDVGPAVPSLLVDGAAVGASPGWLALMSDSGEAHLLSLDGKGHPLDSLAVESSAGISTLLAVRGTQLLATRPRGKSVEAFVLACERGPTPAPSAASPPSPKP